MDKGPILEQNIDLRCNFILMSKSQPLKMCFQKLKTISQNQFVTEVSKATKFHVAELGHQDYYNNNSEAGYCRAIIYPKITRLRVMYADKLV